MCRDWKATFARHEAEVERVRREGFVDHYRVSYLGDGEFLVARPGQGGNFTGFFTRDSADGFITRLKEAGKDVAGKPQV